MSQNAFVEIVSSVVGFFESLGVAQVPAVVQAEQPVLDKEAERQRLHQRMIESAKADEAGSAHSRRSVER